MRRLFCAVKVPVNHAISETLDVFKCKLSGAKINWVEPQNLHLTLKFFGVTPNDMVEPVVEALHQAAAGFPPFSFTMEGCGSFGSMRQPNVIWLGIRNAKILADLYHEVNKHLAPLGYIPDKKIFTPHLTIGRIKTLKDNLTLRSLESEFGTETFATVRTESFFLIESFLRPRGPLYKAVQEFRLGEGHRA